MFRASLAFVALLLLTAVALFQSAAFANANYGMRDNRQASKERRQDIKEMDILERPHRAGHVYGNTVRRRASRG